MKKNAVVKGFIVSKSERSGLSVKLSDGYRGTVALCDITDDYHEQPLGGFTLDQVVKCAVIGYNTQQKHKCLLSLRMSRLEQVVCLFFCLKMKCPFSVCKTYCGFT